MYINKVVSSIRHRVSLEPRGRLGGLFYAKQQLTNVRLINRTGLSLRENKGRQASSWVDDTRVSLLMSTNFPDAQLFVRGDRE